MHEYIVGIKELRNAIASFHEKVDCVKGILADDIIVGPGTKQLSFLLFAVFDGGFYVIVFFIIFCSRICLCIINLTQFIYKNTLPSHS